MGRNSSTSYHRTSKVTIIWTSIPIVMPEHQQNMDMLAEALQLKAFMPTNRINRDHGTSLRVSGAEGKFVLEATHDGWQVISAAHSFSMASTAYFEVRVKE